MGLLWKRTPPENSTHNASPASPLEIETFVEQLHVGHYIDLIFRDAQGQHTDFRRTTLLERLASGSFVVSQSACPITTRLLHQPLEATASQTDPQTNMPMRLGFHTTISAFAEQQRLPDGSPTALILSPPQEIHRVNIRSAFRVAIPLDLSPPIQFFNPQRQPIDLTASLVDLSATGALINYHRPRDTPTPFPLEQLIHLNLDLHYMLGSLDIALTPTQVQFAESNIPCRIVREYAGRRKRSWYIAVEFLQVLDPQADLIHTLLIKIQQQLAARKHR